MSLNDVNNSRPKVRYDPCSNTVMLSLSLDHNAEVVDLIGTPGDIESLGRKILELVSDLHARCEECR